MTRRRKIPVTYDDRVVGEVTEVIHSEHGIEAKITVAGDTARWLGEGATRGLSLPDPPPKTRWIDDLARRIRGGRRG